MMKRLIAALATLVVLAGGRAEPTPAAEADCCWLYCETYRDLCKFTNREEPELCDAFYEGCIDGCKYPGGPTSGAGTGGGGTH